MSIKILLRTAIWVLFYNGIAAQQPEGAILFLDLNNNLLQSIKVNDDLTNATFTIYTNGYESKKNRDSAIKLYEQKFETSDQQMPTFYVTYYSVWQPEILNDLKGLQFKSLDQFNSCTSSKNISSIIYKGDDGVYFKWKVAIIAEE